MRNAIVVAAILSLAPAARAQQRGVQIYERNRVNVESDVVKGAPYSADVVNESVQVLPDGNRIVHRTTSRVYRDSDGRLRREVDRPSGSAEVSINDPVANLFFTLNAETKTARQAPSLARVYTGVANLGGEIERLRLSGEIERLNVMINGQLSSFVARGGSSIVLTGGPGSEQSAEDKLSPKTIEGLRVEGTRRTTTIPAGAIGNERAIVVTSDEWTSPELKVLVLSESNDPRTGTSTYKLVNVKRGEQPASLFQVPADYTVITGPAGGRGGRSAAPQPAPR